MNSKILPPLYIKDQRWFSRLVGAENRKGLLSYYSGKDLRNKIIVCYTPHYLPKPHNVLLQNGLAHLFAIFENYLEFYLYMKKFDVEERNFYEIILGSQPQKAHFDIDIKKDKEIKIEIDQNIYLDAIIRGCVEVLGTYNVKIDLNKDILIFSSSNEEKISYHLVIDNYYHHNNLEAKAFYQLVKQKLPEEVGKYVDHAVYSKVQQFRIFGCQKYGSNRIKRLLGQYYYEGNRYEIEMANKEEIDIFYHSLVAQTNYCSNLPTLVVPNVKNISPYQIVYTDETLKEALNILEMRFPRIFEFHKIESNFIVLRRKKGSYCELCQRIHEKQHPYMFVNKGRLYWNCRRCEEGKHLCLGYLMNVVEERKDKGEEENKEDERKETESKVIKFGNYIISENGISLDEEEPQEPQEPQEQQVVPQVYIPKIFNVSKKMEKIKRRKDGDEDFLLGVNLQEKIKSNEIN